MNELPKGWAWATIDDIVAPLDDGRTLHQGWSPRCEREPSPDERTWGVIKTTAVQQGRFEPEHNKRLPDHLEPRPLIEITPGDILITCAGPRARCGVPCLVRATRPRLMMSGKVYRFRPDERLADPRYVEAYLLSFTAQLAIDTMKTGGSDSGLNLTHARFRQLAIPLAPLNEQHRIVGAIEEQFSRLGAATRGLERCRARLRQLRSAVLSSAFPAAWPREPFAAIARVDGPLVNPSTYQSLPHIAPNHIEAGTGTLLPYQTIGEDGVTSPKYHFVSGQVLYSKIRPYLAKAVVVDFEGLCSADMYPITTDLDPRFLRWWMLTADFTKSAAGQQGRSVLPKINREQLDRLPVPVISREEQERTVDELESRLSIVDAMHSTVEANVRRGDQLRRSILHHAFGGHLVHQDPADDAADVLMERIKSERPEPVNKPTRRRKTKAATE